MRIWSCSSRTCASAIVACLIAFSIQAPAVSQEVDTSTIMQGTTAEPLERIPPEYPWRAARAGKEGWVLLSMVITKQGTISEIVVEDTSGVKELESAAIEAVSKWRYKPATWNGVPVEQCHNLQKVTFKIEDSIGARSSYIRQAKVASRHIKENNFGAAQFVIDELFQKSELNLYETSRLWLLQYQVDIGRGDRRKAFNSLERVWALNGDTIEEEIHDEVLGALLVLQLQFQHYAEALKTFDLLKEKRNGLKGRENLAKTIQELQLMLDNPRPLGIDGLIENDCNCESEDLSWGYQLLRKKFGIEDVAGNVEHIELWCDYKKVVDTAIEERVWEIPENWGQCRLQVHGDEGTTFKLVEYSN